MRSLGHGIVENYPVQQEHKKHSLALHILKHIYLKADDSFKNNQPTQVILIFMEIRFRKQQPFNATIKCLKSLKEQYLSVVEKMMGKFLDIT